MNWNRTKLRVFMFALLALAGCEEIQTSTWIVKLSADPTLHEVELYREVEAERPARAFAYSIEFPQSYYFYEDNHRHLKQTTIGLLFDRATLGPFAPVVIKEAAKPEYEKRYVRPERILSEKYRLRSLLVIITGLHGEQHIRRPALPKEAMPELPGFLWHARATPGNPGSGGAMLHGYSTSDPPTHASCPAIDGDCTVEIQYLRSKVRYRWPKADIEQAIPVARRLTAILARHTKRRGG